MIMQDKKGVQKLWKKALHKYRFVIMTDDSFEEKLSVKLSRFNVLGFSGIFVLLCFLSAIFFMTKTPLREYLPGKAKSDIQNELIILAKKADSLLVVLDRQKQYLQNINTIISGQEVKDLEFDFEENNYDIELTFEKSIEDSLLRLDVEAEERGSLQTTNRTETNIILFYPPLKGVITDRFNSQSKHFGIDLVAKEKTKIAAILDGTVIISNWTSETGYVIGVQHKGGYISFYKHNSMLLKTAGDFVKTGEQIAIIGNSGELSTGPHLHFELWQNGIPVDPENYILF